MAFAADRSKAVVLLLLIYCLMYFPFFVEVLCLSLFCYALLCVHSSFAITLKTLSLKNASGRWQCLEEEEKAGCFAIIVLQMYCYYKCSVALPHGAVGWSAVCDRGIS